MKNFLLTCFLALLCLVGRYFTASSKVADSPGAELLHRSDSPNRGGAILSDTFRYSVAPLQDNPTVVELDNRAITQAPFSPLRGAGGTNGHPATHRASDTCPPWWIQHPTPLPTPQLSLELSGNERSKLAPHGSGLSTVDCGPKYETATSLFGAPRSDVSGQLCDLTDPKPQLSLELSGNERSKLVPNSSGLSTVDRGPNLPSSSIGHPTAVELDYRAITQALFSPLRGAGGTTGHPIALPSQKGSSLVDNSTSQGQEEGNTPAQMGENASVLIYGEIINPDSLGPLTLRATPYYLDEKSSFLKETFPITMEKGEFFDGVLNPMVKKFTVRFHVPKRASYFSLFLGDKPILENYLTWPGDSLKISLDLKHQQVLFAGEKSAFYEAQYLIKRQQAQREFATPRQLVIPATSSLLQDQEKAQKFEKFKNIYGSQLLVLQPGKPSLDLWMEEIRNSEKILGPQLSVLDSYSEILNADQLDLLQAEIYGGFYFSALSTFRKFHWAGLDKHLTPVEKEDYLGQIRQLVTGIRDQGFGLQTKLVSAGYLNLTLEKMILLALMDHRSFSALIEENFQGELADRIKASYLSNYLSAHTDQEKLLGSYLESTSHSPWKDRMEQLKKSHVTGQPILPITLTDLQGNRISGEDLDGVPTLIYFYFSTCSHSAEYFKNQLFPLYQKIKERGIRLIAVSVDEDPELWRSRISSYSDPSIPNFNLSGDSKTLWKESYEINSYPRVMFVDREARILSFNIRVLNKGDKSLLEEFENHFQDQFSDKPKSNPAL